MTAYLLVLILLVGFVLWALLSRPGDPTDAPTPEALEERQRQIDQAHFTELL